MRYVGLFALIGIRLILGIPRALANSVGLCFDSEFEIGGKIVKRPERFNTKAHKAAFEAVGRYVQDALVRDAMLVFQDSSVTQPKNFWGYNKMAPPDVWHEVLEYYAQQGCIEGYWVLKLPLYGDNPTFLSTPSWAANGEALAKRKVNVIAGEVAEADVFSPSLITEAQREELLGHDYAKHPNHGIGNGSWQHKTQEWINLRPEHFERLYYRRRTVLSEKDLTDGAEKLRDVLTMAAK